MGALRISFQAASARWTARPPWTCRSSSRPISGRRRYWRAHVPVVIGALRCEGFPLLQPETARTNTSSSAPVPTVDKRIETSAITLVVEIGFKCLSAPTPAIRATCAPGLDQRAPRPLSMTCLNALHRWIRACVAAATAPPLLQLTVRGQNRDTRGAVARRRPRTMPLRKSQTLCVPYEGSAGGSELGHRAVDDHGREGEDKLHEESPPPFRRPGGRVSRVQRRKDRHLSLLDLVVEFPDDGRHAGRVVQDERRTRPQSR